MVVHLQLGLADAGGEHRAAERLCGQVHHEAGRA